MGDVDGRGAHQPDVAVNPAAGIPARGFRRVVQADGEDIFGAVRLQERREVEPERGVAVGPAADELAVAPDDRVSHRAVDVEVGTAVLGGVGGEREVLAVPADALPGKLAGLAGELLLEGTGDRPIVREVELLPSVVIEGGLGAGHVVAEVVGHAGDGDGVPGEETLAGGQDGVLDFRVGEGVAVDAGRVAVLEEPVGVEVVALAERGSVGGAGGQRQEERDGKVAE